MDTEIKTLVARLVALQAALRLSDGEMAGRFRDQRGRLLLGSERTFERIRKGDWGDGKLNPDRWRARIREAVQQIDGGTPVQDVFRDLPFFRHHCAELVRLETARTDRRILAILAWTGTGKSVWARQMVADRPESRTYMRCHSALRNRGTNICLEMIKALGADPGEYKGFKESLDLVTAMLAASPRTVFLDEAHEGGVELMKLVRHWVDQTESRFVYLAFPTEWNRVLTSQTGALAEAKQFIGRALKPVSDGWANGPGDKDIAIYLRREAELNGEADGLAAEVASSVRRDGGLRLLADAVAEAITLADVDDRSLAASDVVAALRRCGSGLQVRTGKEKEAK